MLGESRIIPGHENLNLVPHTATEYVVVSVLNSEEE
jgi:hypothetical protein